MAYEHLHLEREEPINSRHPRRFGGGFEPDDLVPRMSPTPWPSCWPTANRLMHSSTLRCKQCCKPVLKRVHAHGLETGPDGGARIQIYGHSE